MSKKLLDQADALMRRRSFVVGTQQDDADAVDDPGDDSAAEDLPILTDVVTDQILAKESLTRGEKACTLAAGTLVTPEFERALRERVAQLLVERQVLLAQEIEAWLDEQMPQLVIRAMDGITDHLVALLANRAKDELLPRLEAILSPPAATETDADRTD